MSITIEQLVSDQRLATHVVSGASGLGRDIGWAHVCELPTPWEWIGEGDLLMTTGLGIPPSESAQVEYVERLADVGAAGVAIGEDMNAPALTERMLRSADERDLPLLFTRYDIPFMALARAVAEASQREERLRIGQTVGVYELLRRSSMLDLTLKELVSALAEVISCPLEIAEPGTARSLLTGRLVPEPLRDAVRRTARRTGDQRPALLHLADGEGVGVMTPGPRPAMLVALPGRGRAPDSTVLRHVAAAIALQEARVFAERERSRRLGASLLAQLLDQRLDPAVAHAQLVDRGLGEGPFVLLACVGAEAGDDLHQLHHVLEDVGILHLMLTRGSITNVLVRDDVRSLEMLRSALPADAAAGVSDTFSGPSDLVAAQREARWALHRALERKVALVHHGDDFGGSLFLPGDRDDARAAARRVLGVLIDYDATHGSPLVESLRTFLEENRSWQRTSTRLHIHKQTLVYRIGRIEALTGRSLSNTSDVAELWLGLQAAASSAISE